MLDQLLISIFLFALGFMLMFAERKRRLNAPVTIPEKILTYKYGILSILGGIYVLLRLLYNLLFGDNV
jgi:hypothetical protein